jgi:3-oxoacyl-[acyl-carrier-protein] synthase-3
MLQKLADKLKIPHAKMPMNVVERFGNSSGVTIPVAIASNLADQLKSGHCRACLAGYGVGLTWTSMLMRLGGLAFCELIDFP